MGDGFLVSFETPDAIGCAVAIQRSFDGRRRREQGLRRVSVSDRTERERRRTPRPVGWYPRSRLSVPDGHGGRWADVLEGPGDGVGCHVDPRDLAAVAAYPHRAGSGGQVLGVVGEVRAANRARITWH
jgi:hypothetical protein